jgi:diguanylate cyclase (GGDEF)-like protein
VQHVAARAAIRFKSILETADTPFVAQHSDQSGEDLTLRRVRTVGGLVLSVLMAVTAIVTFVAPALSASADGRVALGVCLTAIAAALAALTWTTRRRVGWTGLGGPGGAALGLIAVAGLLHVVLTGTTAGTVLVAFAVSSAGYVLAGRRSLLVASALAWALWVVAVAVSVAAGIAVIDGHLASWTAAAVGIVLATFPAYLTLLAREREALAIEAAREQAAGAAVVDRVTGAANRLGLAMIARPMIENARRQGQAVHCLYVDLEEFRTVNERAGWDAGDELLAAAAEALRGSTRLTDVVARWSADEFVVLGPGTGTSPLEMERRVRKRLVDACPVPADVWTPRVSVGSSTLVPWDDGDLEDLTRRADEDMHLRRSLRRRSRVAGRTPTPDGAGHEGGTAPAVG